MSRVFLHYIISFHRFDGLLCSAQKWALHVHVGHLILSVSQRMILYFHSTYSPVLCLFSSSLLWTFTQEKPYSQLSKASIPVHAGNSHSKPISVHQKKRLIVYTGIYTYTQLLLIAHCYYFWHAGSFWMPPLSPYCFLLLPRSLAPWAHLS